MTEPSALLPCPMCAAVARRSIASARNGPDNYAIGCSKCIITTEWVTTEAEAITAWNTRARPVDEAMVERLYKHIEHGDEKHRQWLWDQLHEFFAALSAITPGASA